MDLFSSKVKNTERFYVNLVLMIYWLPAFIIDWTQQYPTYNGIHYFTDYLSNLGQILILAHLLTSIYNSWLQRKGQLSKTMFQIENKITQLDGIPKRLCFQAGLYLVGDF